MDTGDLIPPSLPRLRVVPTLQKGEIPPLWQRGVRGDFGRICLINYGLLSNTTQSSRFVYSAINKPLPLNFDSLYHFC